MTGRGLARACWIRMCSGIWGRRGSAWGSPKPCSAVLFDASTDLKSSGRGGGGVSLGRSREHGGSRTGAQLGRAPRGGSGGTWVGSGGEGEGGGWAELTSTAVGAGRLPVTVLSFGGLQVTASDVLLGRRPLFGGRGGEGLDKAVPLVITWESSAENKNHKSHNV